MHIFYFPVTAASLYPAHKQKPKTSKRITRGSEDAGCFQLLPPEKSKNPKTFLRHMVCLGFFSLFGVLFVCFFVLLGGVCFFFGGTTYFERPRAISVKPLPLSMEFSRFRDI